ncbi:cellulose binding domain-containing protein [Microbispora sp. CA-135349]|uniref:cellulose binding domain-containing protein n=1 Tax=Microbispora sp. CA-135349 TaxID=3239953 RepID=UPI003D8A13A7
MKRTMKGLAGIVAGGALLTSALVAASAAPASAATPWRTYQCEGLHASVSYRVTNSWNTGFLGEVRIENSGDVIRNWELTWDWTGAQHVAGVGGVGYTQIGRTVYVNGLPHNSDVPAAGQLGFDFNSGGEAAVPDAFTLQGAVCA